MTQSSRSLLVPYLALVVAGLCVLNWWQATVPIDISPLVVEPFGDSGEMTTKPTNAANNKVPALSELAETLKRPIFRSDRRPPVAKPAEEKPAASQELPVPAASADTLRLVGMMRSGTAARRALIRVAGLPNAEWVEVGGQVGGWTVGTIEKDRVIVQRNGDKAELKLFTPKPAANPGP
jgi:hypothetical protein